MLYSIVFVCNADANGDLGPWSNWAIVYKHPHSLPDSFSRTDSQAGRFYVNRGINKRVLRILKINTVHTSIVTFIFIQEPTVDALVSDYL